MKRHFLGLISCLVVLSLVLSCPFAFAGVKGELRFLKPRYKAGPPPIVLAAFGTSTKAQVTFDHLDKLIRDAFPDHEIHWAFTSRIIREKMNARWAQAGKKIRLKGLSQVLADLQAKGYRQVVVQSMHVFPGEEFVHVQRIAHFPGLDISLGEPLFSQWEDVKKVLSGLEKDFLAPSKGCVILAGHGSPNTYQAPSTAVYLALDRLLSSRYENVFLGSVEGVPDAQDAIKRALAYKGDHVRIVPLMLVAGDHVMNDIMGKEPGEDGEGSWRLSLEHAGKKVDAPEINVGNKTYYKGLGFYDVVGDVFIEHIKQALRDLE